MPANPLRGKTERQPSHGCHGRQLLGREDRKLVSQERTKAYLMAGTKNTRLWSVHGMSSGYLHLWYL